MHHDLEIYDTTLRDGTQGEGVNLSLIDKLALAKVLDWLGVAWIEGGWPMSNEKDKAFFRDVRSLGLTHAKISAFGSTRHIKNPPAEDANLLALVAAKADATCIFGKSWDLHVRDALRVSLEDNLAMIATSVEFLAKTTGKPVFYDAEHFFDGWKANPEYAMQTLSAAYGAGAARIVLCDTNGGRLPSEITMALAQVRAHLPQAVLGIHVHNDGGLAVANTLAAIEAGCVQIQGTMNGVGERCGNVDLCAVIANAELKFDRRCLPPGRLTRLAEASRTVWERINLAGPANQPFVGRAAFAHKGGIHVSAVQRNTLTYEHVRPELIGNERRILVSELSGRSNIQAKLSDRYPGLSDPALQKAVLDEIVAKENAGWSFEAAEGSFELLVRRHVGAFKQSFRLHHYRVHGLGTESGAADHLVEAAVKVEVGGEVKLTAAEGHGPIDALNQALQAALRSTFPQLAELHLTDYKVRVVDSKDGTAAKVRVLIEHQFRGRSFGTIGVSENIIAASCSALVEGVECALQG